MRHTSVWHTFWQSVRSPCVWTSWVYGAAMPFESCKIFLLIRTLRRQGQESTLSSALMTMRRRMKVTLRRLHRQPQRLQNQKRRCLRRANQRTRPQVTKHQPIRKAQQKKRCVVNLWLTCEFMETYNYRDVVFFLWLFLWLTFFCSGAALGSSAVQWQWGWGGRGWRRWQQV